MNNKSKWFYLIQWTWGLPQNLVGALVTLFLKLQCKHNFGWNGEAYVTYLRTEKSFGGLSLGMFHFINGKRIRLDLDDAWTHDTLIHEMGHSVQSMILGPIQLLVIELPSALWYHFGHNFRKKYNLSYYWLFCEGWANTAGIQWTGKEFISQDMLQHGRYGKPW